MSILGMVGGAVVVSGGTVLALLNYVNGMIDTKNQPLRDSVAVVQEDNKSIIQDVATMKQDLKDIKSYWHIPSDPPRPTSTISKNGQ